MLSRYIVPPLTPFLFALGIVSTFPCLSFAAPGGELLALASKAEKAGQWEEALHLYNQIAREDRDPKFREKLQLCLRRVLQDKRHHDLQMREDFFDLGYAQGLKIYAEALEKLQFNHIEKGKCSTEKLFEEGWIEFRISLADPAFRNRYLPEASLAEIELFQNWLKEFVHSAKPVNIAEAGKALEEIANRARRYLLLHKSNAVILEFLCGACHSLDEYTSYVPRIALSDERAENLLPTIDETTLVRQGIGYLKIIGFSESTLREFDNSLAKLKMQGQPLRSMILDLRGNAGGQLEAAVALARRFLPAGIIASVEGRTPETNKTYMATGGVNVLDLPLIILVDQGTASAAEVLAAALGENRRATLIGTDTHGKGCVQGLSKFKTGASRDEQGREIPSPAGALRMTLAKLYGPNGLALNGVTPEVVVRESSRQLDAAIEYADRLSTRPLRGMP